MKEDRKETFRKWATLIVSSLALLVTCFRDPIVLTLKSNVREVIRDEMDRYEIALAGDSRRDRRRETEAELLSRMNQELETLREVVTRNGTDRATLMQLNNCLISIESKLDLLTKAAQRDRQAPNKR
jgi:hypothetical protein